MTQSNAVNVMRIHEDQLLGHLGKADWVIALPEDLPNFTITTHWRHALQAYSGKQFVRWVMEGVDRVFTHDYDPPWDCSGSLRKIPADPLMLLVRHALLSDWAKNEYSGDSTATYDSGMGLHWETHERTIGEYVEEQITEYARVHCMNFWGLDEAHLFEDGRWDNSDIFFVLPTLSFALVEDILQLSTTDAWKQFEADIHAENEAKRKKAEHYQQMLEQVRQFWERHFPDLIGIRIDIPLFRDLMLEQRIAEVLADADPDIIRMMAEIHGIHFPGNYSNTVGEHIQAIVKRANM